jgi:hypothetical protein
MLAMSEGRTMSQSGSSDAVLLKLARAIAAGETEAVLRLLTEMPSLARRNNGGSTPLKLARLTTGRGGSGSVEAKAQQREILRLLAPHDPLAARGAR